MVDLKQQLNVPRDVATTLGRDAQAIARRGEYEAPSGRTVSIADAVQLAVRDTQSYPPGQHPRLRDRGSVETRITVENTTTLAAAQRLLESCRAEFRFRDRTGWRIPEWCSGTGRVSGSVVRTGCVP